MDQLHHISVTFQWNLMKWRFFWKIFYRSPSTYCRYSQTVRLASNQYRDAIRKPAEVALYWIKYVAKHKGAQHLRSASIDLSDLTLYSVDVWLSLIVFVFSLVMLFVGLRRLFYVIIAWLV